MLRQHYSSDSDSDSSLAASVSLQAAAATLDSPMLINDSIKRKDNNLTPDSADDADSLSDTHSTRSKVVLSPTASPTSSPSTSSSSTTLASLTASSGRPSNRSSPSFAPSVAVTLANKPTSASGAAAPSGGSEDNADNALSSELAQLNISNAANSPVAVAVANVTAAQSPQSATRGEPDPKKLFVSNLSFDTTPDDVETVFKVFGDVEIRLQSDPYTGRSKGFAFVAFATPDAAARAKAACEGQPLKGRCIRIEYAVQKYDKPQSGFSAGLKRIERPGRSAIIQQLMKEGGRRNATANQFNPLQSQQRFAANQNLNAAANTNSDDEDPLFNNGRSSTHSQRHQSHSNAFRDTHESAATHPLTSSYTGNQGSTSPTPSNSSSSSTGSSHRHHGRHHHTNSNGSSNGDILNPNAYPLDYAQAYGYAPNNAYAYVRPALTHYMPGAASYAANTSTANFGRVSHHQNAYSYDGRFGMPLGLPLLYHPAAAAAAAHQHAVAVQTAAAMSSAAANSLTQSELASSAFNALSFPDSPLRSPNVANAVAVTNSPPTTPLPPASGSPILHASGGELLPSAISLNANLYSAAVAAATASMPITYHHPNMAANTAHHIPIYPAPPFANAP